MTRDIMPRLASSACLDEETLESMALEGRHSRSAAAGSEDSTVIEARLHVAACARCTRRLARIQEDNELLAAGIRALHADPDSAPTPAAEGYSMLREISRGGQGVVFEALQRSTSRRVAIKQLTSGRFATTTQRRRFEREVEIVASLRHPGIVTLLDSGISPTGEAYCVMELVDGVPLDRHLAVRRRASPVSVEEVLRLFAAICRAVSHAHQRGVIHRDLKPSNILVDRDGEPRVLDFGLARPIQALDGTVTEENHFAGSFNYAAPERFTRDGRDGTDVRCDVYSLGVVLHEALTGTTPCAGAASLDELLRLKAQPPPVRPRTLAPMDADTETILLKALAPDPTRRYQSVAELLGDVERRLAGRPIIARQENTVYVLWKLASRHRIITAVALPTALLLVGLGIALGVTSASHDRERSRAVDTLRTFREVLAAADPLNDDRRRASLESYLTQVNAIVNGELRDQPDVAAALLNTLGEISLGDADYATALERFEQALVLGRAAHDGPNEQVAESLHQLGRVAFFEGRFASAEEFYRNALEMRRSLHGETHPDVALTTGHLGSALRRMGRLEAAEAFIRGALEIRLRDRRSTNEEIASAWNNLGSFLREHGHLDEAMMASDRALQMIEVERGPDDWRVAQALRNRAACSIAGDDLVTAGADLERAVVIFEARVPTDHPWLASTRGELAGLRLRLGALDDAESLARASLDSLQRRLDPGHPKVVEGSQLLASILMARGRPDEAAAVIAPAPEQPAEPFPALKARPDSQHRPTDTKPAP